MLSWHHRSLLRLTALGILGKFTYLLVFEAKGKYTKDGEQVSSLVSIFYSRFLDLEAMDIVILIFLNPEILRSLYICIHRPMDPWGLYLTWVNGQFHMEFITIHMDCTWFHMEFRHIPWTSPYGFHGTNPYGIVNYHIYSVLTILSKDKFYTVDKLNPQLLQEEQC